GGEVHRAADVGVPLRLGAGAAGADVGHPHRAGGGAVGLPHLHAPAVADDAVAGREVQPRVGDHPLELAEYRVAAAGVDVFHPHRPRVGAVGLPQLPAAAARDVVVAGREQQGAV